MMRWSRRACQILLLFSLLLALAACGDEEAPKTDLPKLDNNMPGGALSFNHKLDQEHLNMTSRFSTSYNTQKWRVTDSKTVNIQLDEVTSSSETTVLVEHVHIDVSLKSTLAILDGSKQDSADFKLSTGSEAGVLVSNAYPYMNVMSIEGFSQNVIESWTRYVDGYAITKTEEKRLTEDNLVQRGGVYANKIQVVWFLLIKSSSESHYHAGVITDEFVIPVAKAQS